MLNVFKERSRGSECNTGLIYGLISPTFDCGNYFVELFVSCSFRIVSLRATKSPKFSVLQTGKNCGPREPSPSAASAVSSTMYLLM